MRSDERGHYREQAARARRLAGGVSHHRDLRQRLLDVARRYDEVADDIEQGAAELRHPDLHEFDRS
jgi:hypothetical protein